MRSSPPPCGSSGALDEVEFFKRALTTAEIGSLWSAGSAGKCKPDRLAHADPHADRRPVLVVLRRCGGQQPLLSLHHLPDRARASSAAIPAAAPASPASRPTTSPTSAPATASRAARSPRSSPAPPASPSHPHHPADLRRCAARQHLLPLDRADGGARASSAAIPAAARANRAIRPATAPTSAPMPPSPAASSPRSTPTRAVYDRDDPDRPADLRGRAPRQHLLALHRADHPARAYQRLSLRRRRRTLRPAAAAPTTAPAPRHPRPDRQDRRQHLLPRLRHPDRPVIPLRPG